MRATFRAGDLVPELGLVAWMQSDGATTTNIPPTSPPAQESMGLEGRM